VGSFSVVRSNKYTWVDIGSSYLPGEVIAAFLWAQMEETDQITRKRLAIWSFYHQPLETAEKLRRPVLSKECKHNAHMYYIVLPNLETRTQAIAQMKRAGINTVFHSMMRHMEKNTDVLMTIFQLPV
jgi:dTDP-4-amino-4,6-dideoxygalactose transaminase